MKILVVEDNDLHINAAKEQLKNHDVTIVKSLIDFYPWGDRKGDIPWKEREAFNLSEYDVVLTDINIPSPVDESPYVMDGPTGLLVVFKALQSGVKYIGALTDASHHSLNPIAKGLDMWLHSEKPIDTGNSKIHLECYNACEDTYPAKNWERVLSILLK